MREQKSDTSENQEITELGYPEPEDSELLVDPVSLLEFRLFSPIESPKAYPIRV